MSSIESTVSEIETTYHSILKDLEAYTVKPNYTDTNYGKMQNNEGFKIISEDYLLSLLRKIMVFQRKIEYSLDLTYKLFKKTDKIGRLSTISTQVLSRLTDTKTEFGKITYYYNREYKIVGIIPLLKLAHSSLLEQDNVECTRLSYCVYRGFKLLNSSLIEMEEELRLISALTTYSIEKKVVLKNNLVMNNFEEVAISLEEAESNLEIEHFKDSVSRCRDAIEVYTAMIREQETGERTDKHFATDMGKLAKLGVFDEASQKLAQGVYSFLSLKGSHKYDSKKVEIYDAETALKETYSLLEMLSEKLKENRDSNKKKTDKKYGQG